MAVILVVEPDSQVSEIIRRILVRAGHDAVCVSSSAEGEKLYRSQHFDLVMGDGSEEIVWMGHLHEEGQSVLVVTGTIASGLPTVEKPHLGRLVDRISQLLNSA